MGVRKGEPWGRPAAAPPETAVDGDDAALAEAVSGRPGVRVRWRPRAGADFARVVNVMRAGDDDGTVASAAVDLPCDALRVSAPDGGRLAVNMVVVGTPPDRQHRFTRSRPVQVVVDGRVVHDGPATAVVVGNGQYLRGRDLIPRGHPGDGRGEVQVYTVPRAQRAAMRARLAGGDHLPHPGVRQFGGRSVEVVARGRRRLPLEVDGHRVPPGLGRGAHLTVTVEPAAFTLVT